MQAIVLTCLSYIKLFFDLKRESTSPQVSEYKS